MTNGKKGDRLIIDDPRAEWVRWEPTSDPKARPFHGLAPPSVFFDTLEPPRDLGRFNCCGDYVLPPVSGDWIVAPTRENPFDPWIGTGPVGGPTVRNDDGEAPPFRMAGLDRLRADGEVVVRFGQAAGQVADVLADLDYRIVTSVRLDRDLLEIEREDERFRAEIDRRAAILSRAVDEAMLRPGFNFAEHAFGGPALDALLAGGFVGSPPCETVARVRHVDQAGPRSKRQRRRERGRAKGGAR